MADLGRSWMLRSRSDLSNSAAAAAVRSYLYRRRLVTRQVTQKFNRYVVTVNAALPRCPLPLAKMTARPQRPPNPRRPSPMDTARRRSREQVHNVHFLLLAPFVVAARCFCLFGFFPDRPDRSTSFGRFGDFFVGVFRVEKFELVIWGGIFCK